MALPKTGTRRIVVDDKPYCWIANGRDEGIFVYVQAIDRKGQLLRWVLDYKGWYCQFIVSPSIVRRIIRSARKQGWQPDQHGPLFMPPGERWDDLGIREQDFMSICESTGNVARPRLGRLPRCLC